VWTCIVARGRAPKLDAKGGYTAASAVRRVAVCTTARAMSPEEATRAAATASPWRERAAWPKNSSGLHKRRKGKRELSAVGTRASITHWWSPHGRGVGSQRVQVSAQDPGVRERGGQRRATSALWSSG
jgi:hypothetical protein